MVIFLVIVSVILAATLAFVTIVWRIEASNVEEEKCRRYAVERELDLVRKVLRESVAKMTAKDGIIESLQAKLNHTRAISERARSVLGGTE